MFCGMAVDICKNTGQVTVNGAKADFCEALSVFDWLCDGKSEAKSAGVYAPVSSLPGVLVRGQGLLMKAPELAEKIDADPARFCQICKELGGKPRDMGDISFEIPVFPELSMVLKFYHADEEFPADLTFLWDQNILQFVRYETVYYIAATIKKHLNSLLPREQAAYIQPIGFI